MKSSGASNPGPGSLCSLTTFGTVSGVFEGLCGLRRGYHERCNHPFPLPIAFSIFIPLPFALAVGISAREWW